MSCLYNKLKKKIDQVKCSFLFQILGEGGKYAKINCVEKTTISLFFQAIRKNVDFGKHKNMTLSALKNILCDLIWVSQYFFFKETEHFQMSKKRGPVATLRPVSCKALSVGLWEEDSISLSLFMFATKQSKCWIYIIHNPLEIY